MVELLMWLSDGAYPRLCCKVYTTYEVVEAYH